MREGHSVLFFRKKKKHFRKVKSITEKEIRFECNISIILKAGSGYDGDVTVWLIRADRKDHVHRYHLLFLIILMRLNVFVVIHQLKVCRVAAIESLPFYILSITTSSD